jgi:polysaccharide pyruvyl transferase WcaK-like protein
MGGYSKNNMFALSGDYRSFVRDLTCQFANLPNLRILLVPHTFEEGAQSDYRACRQLWEELPPDLQARVHCLTSKHDQSEMKAIIGQCAFLIGSRMHACIGALSQGIPAAGIAYSRKFAGVFETVGMTESVLDARTLSPKEIQEKCLELYAQRAELAARLQPQVQAARAAVLNCFSNHIIRNADATRTPEHHAPSAKELS